MRLTRTEQEQHLHQAIGRLIRQKRLARGWEPMQLAMAMGVSAESARPSISRAETGKQRFTIDYLGRIAAALEISIKDLIPDEGEE